jgi:flagellar biosynthesis anti-sigma factor FlgM
MPDPIQGINTAVPFNLTSRGRYAAALSEASAAPQSPIDSDVDSADVGKTAALLQSIVETASSIPDVDQARVACLQQAVQAGAVHADPHRIAQSFTELEALLA